jgi:predicted Zn-dependent peptidase
MMVNAAFPENEMQREKGVVIQEIMMYQDNPAALVMDKWKEFYYGDNSYGRSTLGPKENVEKFTREDLIKHKADLYTKDNLIIIIAGKIENQSKLEAQIAGIFESLPATKRIEQPKYTDILPKVHEDVYKKKTEQNHLIISAR